MTFSPDGVVIAATSDDVIRLWDREGRPFRPLRGHDGPVNDLSFAPDGRTLVSASEDGTALVWDMTALSPPVGLPRLVPPDRCWENLRSEDAEKAFQAICLFRRKPIETVTLLQNRLTPTAPLDPKRIERLLAELDSEKSTMRRQAVQQLEAMDLQVEVALRKALASTKSAEVHRSLRRILDKLDESALPPDRLREVRAVEVLEHLGTFPAECLLRKLMKGADSRLTREARAAIERLENKVRKHRPRTR
jgi:hypothetical protein